MRNRLDRVHGADLPVVTCWPADAEFANLRVWQDANEDGISDAGELKTLAELRRMLCGHPKANEGAIASISIDRIDVTGTNVGHDRGFAAAFTRAPSPRAFGCPPATGAGSMGAAETNYFQTDRADMVDPTPAFTPAEGVRQAAAAGGIR
jgi:hypothetical protein